MIPKEKEELIGRLYNWKFESAMRYVDNDIEEQDVYLIKALAQVFQNCGHFDGDMGNIVQAAVNSIMPEDE